MTEISRVAGIVEPLRAYNWRVQITRAPAGVGLNEGLQFRARTTRVPEKSFDTIEIPYRWYRWFVQGREAMDKTVELTFWEGVDAAVYNALDAWRKAVADWSTGMQGRKSDVTGEVQLQLLDGQDNVVKTFTLKNAMLVALEAIELTYEDSRTVDITARFVYDWIEEQ